MKKNILHIMNYAAAYRGNFIDSLEYLDAKLNSSNMSNNYMFMREAREGKSYGWISELESNGKNVSFLIGNIISDSKKMKAVIKEKKISLVHTHFISMRHFLSIYIATRATKLPIVMHMHNHSQEVRNFIKRGLRRYLYSRCVMIACSQSVYESIERDYPKNKKYSIDNGVNFDRLEEYEILTDSVYGLDRNSIKFLTFGFDFFRKGVDLTVKALKILHDKGNNVGLLISLSTNFEEVKKHIVYTIGEMPKWINIIPARNDVATLYNYVDIFLSPSREEGLPYSVIEAAYSKCNIVLSDISAQRNLKIPYAYWFTSEDIDDYQRKICIAMNSHAQKVNHWIEVKKKVSQNYALDTWAENIMTVYNSML